MSMFDKQKATLKMKEIDANGMIAGVINTFTLKVERYNAPSAKTERNGNRVTSPSSAPMAMVVRIPAKRCTPLGPRCPPGTLRTNSNNFANYIRYNAR